MTQGVKICINPSTKMMFHGGWIPCGEMPSDNQMTIPTIMRKVLLVTVCMENTLSSPCWRTLIIFPRQLRKMNMDPPKESTTINANAWNEDQSGVTQAIMK